MNCSQKKKIKNIKRNVYCKLFNSKLLKKIHERLINFMDKLK